MSNEHVFETLLDYLKKSRGFDFTGYKRPSLMRRVRKQMMSHEIDDFNTYLDYLQVHPEEFLPLFNTILINTTMFRRDALSWDYLQTDVLPELIARKPDNEPIRIWSAGCSSGEEAYTIAMIVVEEVGLEVFRDRVKIYATDVDDDALNVARQATYPAKAMESLPAGWRDKYFEPVNGGAFACCPDLRRRVIFGRHDLVQDAPISRLDLLVCRNTLMYFNAETQSQILDRFHFALNDNGMLFLGEAEMLITHTNLFIPFNLHHRLFCRMLKPSQNVRMLTLPQPLDDSREYRDDEYATLREAATDVVPVAQIVIDRNGLLVMANAVARVLFNLDVLDRGRLFQDLEISYRPIELRSPIEQAYQKNQSIAISNVPRHLQDGDTQYFDIQIDLIKNQNDTAIGVSITFIDMTLYNGLRIELQQANQELQAANEELQSSNEELETTNEELQSTNEELETTNEELETTNEELEITNQELQSTNQELQSINQELQQCTLDLHQANGFLSSMLPNFRAGVMVLNSQCKILRWNPEAENLWGLSGKRVQDKSFFELDLGLPVNELRDPVYQCLKGSIDQYELVLNATLPQGRSIQCRIQLHPLVSLDQEQEGIILLVEKI
ncbi:MAG: CheR family methyltransferase [Cyanobacteria bacterium P01_A01_bin.37]